MTLLWRIIHEILFILGLCILVVGIVAYLFFKRLKTAWSISAACSHQEPSPETKEEPLPPFLDAIKRNDIESVKQLWEEGADPNSFVDKSPQKDGSMRATALMLATRTGDTALVGLLLDAGADIDYCSPRYVTALSVTAANSDLLMLQ